MYTELSLITVNLAKGATLREEKKDGINYLIAPVAIIVPGVLEGANSPPTLYPDDLTSNTAERWDGTLIVLNHPRNNRGEFISVYSQDYDSSTEVGFSSNSKFDEGKQRTEAWIDVDKLRKLDVNLLNSIKAGKKVEVSTGLRGRNVPEQGEFKGRKYVQRLIDFVPDHLALLNSTTGACSIYDGCGVHANENKSIIVEDEDVKRGLIKFLKSLIGVKEKPDSTGESTNLDELETELSTNDLSKGDPVVCTKDELIAPVIANSDHFTEADKTFLNQMDETRLKGLETSAKKTKDLLTNAATLQTDETKKKEEEEAAAKKKKDEEMAANTAADKKPLTEEEWLKNAPESVQVVFNHSKQMIASEKAKLIAKLTNHIKDDAKKQEKIVALQSKSKDELQERVDDLEDLMPPQVNQEDQGFQGLYYGAVGGPNVTANQEATKEVLEIPMIDWSKEDRFSKAGK